MSDARPTEVPDTSRVEREVATATSKTNPWGVTLLVLAGVFFLAALIAWSYGDISANATFDNGVGPTHDQLALYQHIAGVTLAGFGALLVILRITVEAVRWDLARR